jgi:hypothetical protein
VFATDLDGDGDADVLSASPTTITKESPGMRISAADAFGSQQVLTTQADGAASVYATDLDGDGDADVLSASGIWSTARSPGTRISAAAPSAASR